MKHNYSMSYGRVELDALTLADAQLLRQLRNKNSSKFFDSSEITEEAQAKWYTGYLAKENDYMFSVLLLPEKKWVGAVSIYCVDPDVKTAEFGRLVIDRESTEERGLGVDTTLAACAFAFDMLGLETVMLEVFDDNIAAVRTYEKAGFTLSHTDMADGRLVKHMIKTNG